MAMISAACIMMQRDEEDLLEPWLLYHGYLFGFENLHVIDNGSTSRAVRATIDRFSRVGVRFDFGHSEAADYERKHLIVAQKITSLTHSEGYNFYFPIDCDEFVALFDHRGITLSRQSIMSYLEQLSAIPSQRTLRIRAQLFNIPGQSCKFYFEDLPKVLFTGGEVAYLEHGNHHGHLSGAKAEEPVPFTYLHFRNKPFMDFLRQARQKLKDRVDVSDLAAILAYRGHGEHLVPYFSMTEGDYLTSFTRKSALVVPAFHDFMEVLGVAPAMARVSGSPGWEKSAGEEIKLPDGFEGDSYLRANPDVAQSGMHPVVHYHLYGKKERRRLRP